MSEPATSTDGGIPAPAPAAPGRWASWRAWAARALFESALIVFSVFLALALDEQRSARELRARAHEAQSFIAEEIRANRTLLASPMYLPHHERLRAVLDGAAARPGDAATLDAAYDVVFANGIHPAPLRDAVWRSVSGGQVIEKMEPRDVFLLADIYKTHERLEAFNAAMYASLVSSGAERSPGQAEALRLHLGDVIALERQLIRFYDAALFRLDDGDAERR